MRRCVPPVLSSQHPRVAVTPKGLFLVLVLLVRFSTSRYCILVGIGCIHFPSLSKDSACSTAGASRRRTSFGLRRSPGPHRVMPILYDPLAVFRSTFLTGRLFSEVLCSTMFWLSLVLFVLEREVVRRLHNERVSRLNEEMTWPTTLFATLFSYMCSASSRTTATCVRRSSKQENAYINAWLSNATCLPHVSPKLPAGTVQGQLARCDGRLVSHKRHRPASLLVCRGPHGSM